MKKKVYFGLDGCRNGWIAARIEDGHLFIDAHENMERFIEQYPDADEYLIDMAIGLQSDENQVRPDPIARKLLGRKSSSVFSVPCRDAVYVEGSPKDPRVVEEQRRINKLVLKKSLSAQTINIIPKIRELDQFLEKHPEYKNVFCESHPELCFARLNGEVVYSKKSRPEGIEERYHILERFLEPGELGDVQLIANQLKCKKDDVLDAVCLAVTARMKAAGGCESITGDEEHNVNSKGLVMQMVVPDKRAGRLA